MRIVRTDRIGSSIHYLVYPKRYQRGEVYFEINRWRIRTRRVKQLEDYSQIRNSFLVFVNGSLAYTYYHKDRVYKQGLELMHAGWRWKGVVLDMDRLRDSADRTATMFRMNYMCQAIERIARNEKLGPSIRSLQSASRENVELRATMLGVLREVADLVRGLGLSASRWSMYPPSIRKARKMLGLPYKGEIEPEEIDPLAELRNWHESLDR